MSRRYIAILLAAAVASTVVGCGGGDDDSTETRDLSTVPRIGLPVFTGKLTKAQFLAQANERCRESRPSLREEFTRLQRNGGEEDQLFVQMSKRSFLPHIQFWFDDISYFGAPKGDETKVEDLLKAMQWAVYSNEDLRPPTLETMIAGFGSFNRLAREYGLDGCVVDDAFFQAVLAS